MRHLPFFMFGFMLKLSHPDKQRLSPKHGRHLCQTSPPQMFNCYDKYNRE